MNGICSKTSSIAIMGVVALILTGCGAPPKNPAEFRAMGKGGAMFVSSETITVKRPYQQVVETFRQRAPACLNVVISSSRTQKNGSAPVKFSETREWTANVNASSKQMECTLQSRITGGNTVELADYPNKDGHYYFMVDAYPAGQNATRVVITRVVGLSDTLTQAAKNWADGSNLGCPDMTQ